MLGNIICVAGPACETGDCCCKEHFQGQIEQHCLSKTRVKEAVEKILERLNEIDLSDLNINYISLNVGGKATLIELLKELGLSDD